MAFGGPNNPYTANDLYEWSGAGWNLIPAAAKPPRPGNANASRVYTAMTYDARRDKIVLFGSGWFDWSQWRLTNLQPDLWEWDAANGWVNRTVAGSIDLDLHLHFDSHRGVVTKIQGIPAQVAEWDGGATWTGVNPATTPWPWLGAGPHGSFDSDRGLFFVWMRHPNSDVPYTYGTVNQAAFQSIAPGCPGTIGTPNVRLTDLWTRAWMGRTLSVDFQNLPQSRGFLAIGWSNQQAGSLQLPLELTPYGMPGCHARVATDLIVPVTGANNTATWTTPVPQNNALLGISFYLQGYSVNPAANMAGLTASNAVRVTVGRL